MTANNDVVIYNGHTDLTKEVRDWLHNNQISYQLYCTHVFYVDLQFNRDEDYILFKLTFDFLDTNPDNNQ